MTVAINNFPLNIFQFLNKKLALKLNRTLFKSIDLLFANSSYFKSAICSIEKLMKTATRPVIIPTISMTNHLAACF